MDSAAQTRKLVAHVAARLGGTEVLAAKLRISSTAVAHYISGDEPVPDALVLQLIDLILDELERR